MNHLPWGRQKYIKQKLSGINLGHCNTISRDYVSFWLIENIAWVKELDDFKVENQGFVSKISVDGLNIYYDITDDDYHRIERNIHN